MSKEQDMAQRWQKYRELSDEIKYQARVRREAFQECVTALQKITASEYQLLAKEFPQIAAIKDITLEQLLDPESKALNQLDVAYAELTKAVDGWLAYYEGVLK